jgi:D-beta-D-heptose 7-phosphate kinase/D-beta-D-heptose 1-phosphate adenosyltransferase
MKVQIPPFDSVHLLVIGDVMLDRYWYGATSRISPEAPVPVVRVKNAEERPGGAGNVALNAAALGVRSTVIGITGDDEAGGILTRQLEAAGVVCRFQRLSAGSTVTKLRVISRHQQLIRLDFENDFQATETAALLAAFAEALPACDAVVISDYGKGTLANPEEFIRRARAARKPVLVDPKHRDYGRYAGATLITPNMTEFEAVVGSCETDQVLGQKAAALIEKHGLGGLLITRGEQGMTLFRPHKAELHLPAQAREVFDVTGAGDTVIAMLASALAAGCEIEMAVALANIAAGLVVAKLGAATVSLPELHQALAVAGEPGYGVLTQEQLLLAVAEARARGERIVMTNGCFDILHAGHVSYLAQARRLGNRLIVAVNDDASVRHLKGDGRPVNPLERRMAVLAALESVDWVVSFAEATPEALVRNVLPDVLAKGGDYRAEQIAGHACVKANGGRVMVLDYQDGCSTTEIIKGIKALEGGE